VDPSFAFSFFTLAVTSPSLRLSFVVETLDSASSMGMEKGVLNGSWRNSEITSFDFWPMLIVAPFEKTSVAEESAAELTSVFSPKTSLAFSLRTAPPPVSAASTCPDTCAATTLPGFCSVLGLTGEAASATPSEFRFVSCSSGDAATGKAQAHKHAKIRIFMGLYGRN
jgi:hypothetical protein